MKVIKRDQTRVDFDRKKIRSGIERACWKRQVSTEQIDELVSKVVCSIENDFEREVSSGEIGKRVMDGLEILDKVAYVRFASVYHDFKDVDEFITEIQTFDKN